MPTIHTSRLLLRPVTHDDTDGFWELDSDPEVHRYLGGNPIQSREEATRTIEALLQQYEETGMGRLAVIERNSGNFVGWAGLKREARLRPDREYIDLGYRLQRAHWGKGYGTEAARAVLQMGWAHYGLSAIHAAADVENVASNRILQRIGMQWVEQFVWEDKVTCHWYVCHRPDGVPD